MHMAVKVGFDTCFVDGCLAAGVENRVEVGICLEHNINFHDQASE
jgi:hypothetical protein